MVIRMDLVWIVDDCEEEQGLKEATFLMPSFVSSEPICSVSSESSVPTITFFCVAF